MGNTTSWWRTRLKRWRWLLLAVVVLLAVRVSLPLVARRVLVSQASDLLGAQVTLADVDLSLLGGGIVLRDLAVRLRAATVATAGGDESSAAARAREPAAATPPILAWKSLAVSLRWWPLVRRTIQIREIVLDSPQVRVDRLASGEFNFEPLIRAAVTPGEGATAAESTPTNTDARSTTLAFGIDRLALSGGQLRFHDLSVESSEPVEIGIPTIEVRDISLSPDLYGKPSDSRIKIKLDEGSLELGASARLSGTNVALESELHAENLPLHRTRLYIPEVGWSDLKGAADADLSYRFETAKVNELRGSVTLRDLAVLVSDLPEPALSWKRLMVRVDPIDLVGQAATVAAVDLSGAQVVVRPKREEKFPLLTRARSALPAAPETAATGSEEGKGPAWRWLVGTIRVTDSAVLLRSEESALDLLLGLHATDVAPDGESTVDLSVGVGTGSLRLQGNARLEPPGFAGDVHTSGLSLPELISISGALPENLVQSAKLDTDLVVEAGLAKGEGPALGAGDLRMHGKLALSEAEGASGATKVAASAVQLEIGELLLPGVLAPQEAAQSPPAAERIMRLRGALTLREPRVTSGDDEGFLVESRSLALTLADLRLPQLAGSPSARAREPIRVALGDLKLDRPSIRLTRTADGIVLPAAGASSPTPTSPVADTDTPAAPSGGVEVSLDSLGIARGRVAFVDRTFDQPLAVEFSNVKVGARGVRFPELAAQTIAVAVMTPDDGEIDVSGDIAPGGGKLQLEARDVALMPYNPYVIAFSPYRLTSGALTLSTGLKSSGSRYDLKNKITLQDLGIEGAAGESVFERQLGIPLATAMALMRDTQGKIKLKVPVKIDEQGASSDLMATVRSALQAALVGALTSPLKLLGSVTGGGDKVGSFAPAPIAFYAGSGDPTPDGEKTIERLASLLRRRPGIGVKLRSVVTLADARRLREQALLRAWGEAGLFARLLAVGERGTRDRVRAALEARASGELSADDTQALEEWLREIPEPTGEQIRELASARLTRVIEGLREAGDIDDARVAPAQPTADLEAASPAVAIEIGPLASGDSALP